MQKERNKRFAIVVAFLMIAVPFFSNSTGSVNAEPSRHPGVFNHADVPLQLRVSNYWYRRKGSCVHATTATILNYLGLYSKSDWWTDNHHGAQNAYGIIENFNDSGLDYAYTIGDPEFLEWASRNRQITGIWYYYKHSVNFIGFTETHAILLDSNSTGEYNYILKDEFLDEWINTYGGFAFVVIEGSVPPPKPVWR